MNLDLNLGVDLTLQKHMLLTCVVCDGAKTKSSPNLNLMQICTLT